MDYPESAISISSNVNGIKDIKLFFNGAIARQVASKAFTRLSNPAFRMTMIKKPENEMAAKFIANYLKENKMDVTLGTANLETNGKIPKDNLPCNLWLPLQLNPEKSVFMGLVYECRPTIAKEIFAKDLKSKSGKSHSHSHKSKRTHKQAESNIDDNQVEVVVNFQGPAEKANGKKTYQPVGGVFPKELVTNRLKTAVKEKESGKKTEKAENNERKLFSSLGPKQKRNKYTEPSEVDIINIKHHKKRAHSHKSVAESDKPKEVEEKPEEKPEPEAEPEAGQEEVSIELKQHTFDKEPIASVPAPEPQFEHVSENSDDNNNENDEEEDGDGEGEEDEEGNEEEDGNEEEEEE